MVGSQETRYTYSSRGELKRVELPDGRVVEYEHDPLGRRIAKKIDGQVAEKYLWQGRTQLLAVYDVSDEVVMRFEYAGDRMPVRMLKDEQTYYLAYDQVGTLRAVFDAGGSVLKTVEYDSFGNVIADNAPEYAVPFGFAGGLHDIDTGLVRFGFRDYDPDTGRWTAKDPVWFKGGTTDLFEYAAINPISKIDASGLKYWNTKSIGYSGNIGVGLDVMVTLFFDPCTNALVGICRSYDLSFGPGIGFGVLMQDGEYHPFDDVTPPADGFYSGLSGEITIFPFDGPSGGITLDDNWGVQQSIGNAIGFALGGGAVGGYSFCSWAN